MVRRPVAVTLAVCVAVGPLAVSAQQPVRVPRIGYLTSTSHLHAEFGRILLHFAMPKLGYRWHHTSPNIVVLARPGGQRDELLPAAVAELVEGKMDIIIAEGTPAVLAARRGTSTTPIVMAVSGDPVRAGLVATLSRPGGNVTGVTSLSLEVVAKRLQLLREVVPRATRVAVLWNPSNPEKEFEWQELQAVAPRLGVTLQSLEVRGRGDIEPALEAGVRARVGGLLVLDDSVTLFNEDLIVVEAVRNRLPAICGLSVNPSAGALITYGPSVFELTDMAATFVDRILKGAKPADLPVEQPTRFELVVNLKTAKALGLTIPQSVLLRADKVIY